MCHCCSVCINCFAYCSLSLLGYFKCEDSSFFGLAGDQISRSLRNSLWLSIFGRSVAVSSIKEKHFEFYYSKCPKSANGKVVTCYLKVFDFKNFYLNLKKHLEFELEQYSDCLKYCLSYFCFENQDSKFFRDSADLNCCLHI
jgi:hypothetical protein